MTTAATAPAARDVRQSGRPGAVVAAWAAAVVVLLVLVGIASVVLGTRVVSWSEVSGAFTGDADSVAEAAIRQRVPRTVLAMLVGAALGLAGAMMQGATRNPLGDPGILGISSGAALAVVVGIVGFGMQSPAAYIWVAILGAAGAALFVYTVGSLGRGGATPLKLALAGAVTWAACSSLVSAILLPRVQSLADFRAWMIGGVGGASPERILQVLPFLAAGALLSLWLARGLNSLALGDDVAAGLGERVARTRLLAGLAAVTLAGASTAVAGPIAFVGLLVPHACRALVGIDHRWLLPVSALGGAVLLTAADVVGRVVARPEEIDVGIVVAFIGAPVLVHVVRRTRVRAL